jgi:hypothetical protein
MPSNDNKQRNYAPDEQRHERQDTDNNTTTRTEGAQ